MVLSGTIVFTMNFLECSLFFRLKMIEFIIYYRLRRKCIAEWRVANYGTFYHRYLFLPLRKQVRHHIYETCMENECFPMWHSSNNNG